MSSLPETFVIVGAGMAGATAAETLRAEGFGGRILLFGAEPHRPYERPPLSKEYLRGETSGRPNLREEKHYVGEWIDLRLDTSVAALDLDGSAVVTDGGERIGFDRLLLATGARPRRLSLPGGDLGGVHYLRTLDDSQLLAERLSSGVRVAVIGAGWIGSEVAASAREKGNEVTLIEAGSVPLERVLGPEVGAIYRDLHLDRGVRFLGEATVEAIEGTGSVSGVRLGGGELVEADLVVAGIGVEPATELAEAAGLEVDNGILVGADLQTGVGGVFAAGDVANAWRPFYERRVRVEHWVNAEVQGRAAARAMLGRDVGFDEIPYFFSDQYDVGMEYGGLAEPTDQVVFRGDPAGREFIAFWLRGDRLTAGMNVNVWDVNETIRDLIRSRAELSRVDLSDPTVPLEQLAAAGKAA